MLNSSEPLGLPRGSVRAILALLVVGSTLFVTITTGKIPTDLVPLASLVATYYFVTRGNQSGEPVVENPPVPED